MVSPSFCFSLPLTCTLPGCLGRRSGQGPGSQLRRDKRTWTGGPGPPSAGTSSQGLRKEDKRDIFCFTSEIKSPFLQIFKHLTKWQNIQIKTLYDLWVSFQSSNKPLTSVRLSSKRDLMFWISQQSSKIPLSVFSSDNLYVFNIYLYKYLKAGSARDFVRGFCAFCENKKSLQKFWNMNELVSYFVTSWHHRIFFVLRLCWSLGNLFSNKQKYKFQFQNWILSLECSSSALLVALLCSKTDIDSLFSVELLKTKLFKSSN